MENSDIPTPKELSSRQEEEKKQEEIRLERNKQKYYNGYLGDIKTKIISNMNDGKFDGLETFLMPSTWEVEFEPKISEELKGLFSDKNWNLEMNWSNDNPNYYTWKLTESKVELENSK